MKKVKKAGILLVVVAMATQSACAGLCTRLDHLCAAHRDKGAGAAARCKDPVTKHKLKTDYIEPSVAYRRKYGMKWNDDDLTKKPSELFTKFQKLDMAFQDMENRGCTSMRAVIFPHSGNTSFKSEWRYQQKREASRSIAFTSFESRMKAKGYTGIIFDQGFMRIFSNITSEVHEFKDFKNAIIRVDRYGDKNLIKSHRVSDIDTLYECNNRRLIIRNSGIPYEDMPKYLIDLDTKFFVFIGRRKGLEITFPPDRFHDFPWGVKINGLIYAVEPLDVNVRKR